MRSTPAPSAPWPYRSGDPAAPLVASATLAFLVGVMLVLASLLRLGVVASFIFEPVLTGFKAAVGLIIVLDQVPKLLGIHFDKGSLFQNLLGLERYVPRAPAPRVAAAVGRPSRGRDLSRTPDGASRGADILRQRPAGGQSAATLTEAAQPRVLALNFYSSAVMDIKHSALKLLVETAERLRERSILLWLVALDPEALAMVQRSSLGESLGRERLIFNLQTAVERYLS